MVRSCLVSENTGRYLSYSLAWSLYQSVMAKEPPLAELGIRSKLARLSEFVKEGAADGRVTPSLISHPALMRYTVCTSPTLQEDSWHVT